EPLDVVSSANHRMPPAVLDVLLELHTERPVIPNRPRAAIDLGGLENESAPLRERHELLHDVGVCGHARHDRAWGREVGWARANRKCNLTAYESRSRLTFAGGGAGFPSSFATIWSP